jgi:hypothetical protein
MIGDTCVVHDDARSLHEVAMRLDFALKLGTIGSVLVGAVAVYIAFGNNSRQIGAPIFLSYSDRIHHLRQTRLFDVDRHHWPRQTDEADDIRHAISPPIGLSSNAARCAVTAMSRPQYGRFGRLISSGFRVRRHFKTKGPRYDGILKSTGISRLG